MPYIPDENMRVILKPVNVARNVGELNYQIFMTMMAYLGYHGEKLSYQTIAEVLSAAQEAQMEFRRRVAVPYEDKKIDQYGDILPAWAVEALAEAHQTEHE